MMKRTRTINDHGIGLKDEGSRIKDIRVFAEGESVQLWIEVDGHNDFLQYLSAEEAMAFSKAFERCAIKSFKEGA